MCEHYNTCTACDYHSLDTRFMSIVLTKDWKSKGLKKGDTAWICEDCQQAVHDGEYDVEDED